jgi:hypothetical protein
VTEAGRIFRMSLWAAVVWLEHGKTMQADRLLVAEALDAPRSG